jgi:integrase
MTAQRITKRTVDSLQANGNEFMLWDDSVSGFGVRVRATGAKSYVVVYRAGAGRGAPVRRYTIAAVGKITPEGARARAKVILGAVAHGHDPANQKTAERGSPAVAELADRFMADHVQAKRKAGTAEFYRDILDRIVKPALGTTKSDKLTRLQVGRLHSSLSATPFQANRVLAVVGSMYAFAGRAGIVPEGTNPARGIDKFKEGRRERFLTGEELERLGGAIREAETTGIPWTVDDTMPTAKHVPKAKRSTKIASSAAAALRLLLFTGCRLREILHLRWEHVDFERGCLFLPDSKSGRKTVILNAPALAVLARHRNSRASDPQPTPRRCRACRRARKRLARVIRRARSVGGPICCHSHHNSLCHRGHHPPKNNGSRYRPVPRTPIQPLSKVGTPSGSTLTAKPHIARHRAS